jgi:nucleolar protein 58
MMTKITYSPILRFKLKFSPDKVDTMVVQAIALLDDLDKEINIYAMRVKV